MNAAPALPGCGTALLPAGHFTNTMNFNRSLAAIAVGVLLLWQLTAICLLQFSWPPSQAMVPHC